MKKILAVAFFCLPAFGQAAYSGLGLYSGSAAYGASVCGPPDYAPPCSISDTAIHPYVLPIPSWGPNTCDSTSMATLAQCGNLTGAGTVVTTNDDFHAIMTRVTDVNTDTVFGVSNPATTWQTADAPSVNLWNTDDTAFLGLVNGGGDYVFLWDGTTAQLLLTATNGLINFPSATVFSRSARDHVYTLDNTTGPGIYLQDNLVVLRQNSGAVTSSNLFDFSNSQCLMNTVNGYPNDPLRLATITSWTGTGSTVTFQAVNSYATGQTITLSGFGVSTFFNGQSVAVLSSGLTGTQFEIAFGGFSGGTDTGLATATTFPLNQWNGALSDPKDESVFGTSFSVKSGQGSGCYETRWAPGQPGCRVWNTCTGTVTNNGTLLGTITDAPYGGAFGGKASRWKVHDSSQPSATYSEVGPTQSTFIYGTYYEDDYVWDGGLNAVNCGAGAPNWKVSNAYVDGNRVVPLPIDSTVNPAGYIFQIINGISGNSGTDNTIFKTTAAQTPGSDTIDNPGPQQITWRNVGIGTSTTPYFTYSCAGHKWKGALGFAWAKNFTYGNYTNTQLPRLNLGPQNPPGTFITSAGDQHFGNTNDNTTDTQWPWVSSTDVGTTTDLLHGTFPSALYMEGFHVAPPYYSPGNQNCFYDAITCPLGTLGQVRRQFHCHGTGWHRSFDVQNCISVISQTGRYALLATDFMGENGSTAGTPGNPATFLPKCNPGGPMWNSNDNADYPVGTVIYPILSNDSGDYLYKVQSCSASPCTTGATQPDWSTHQSSTVAGMGTFVDGNITWAGAPDVYTPTNTAVQNCRADLMVVKLTR
jgi:hypothetical protein